MYHHCHNIVITVALPPPQHRSLIYGVYGVVAVLVSMGWAYITLILSHCIILYSVALVKRKWICFVAGLISLATIKIEPFNTWQVSCLGMINSQY